VPFLAQQFMQRFARKHGVRVRGIGDDCLAALKTHYWPGNVRELQNVIERAVILSGDSGMLETEHLGFSPQSAFKSNAPAASAASPAAATSTTPAPASETPVSLAEIEKRHVLAVLEKTQQNRTHAAKLLGISVRTLRNKLSEYGVNSKDDAAAEIE
jgi:DNA-binding NtrC family response regulator